MDKRISVIIPCYNEEEYIERSIRSFTESEYPFPLLEIIIVDGGSTDNTLSIIATIKALHDNIIVLHNPEKLTPVSLNMGIHYASGDYIMIASAHSQFPPDYIPDILKIIMESGCDVCGGAIDTRVVNSTPVSEAIVRILSSRLGVGNSLFRTEKDLIVPADTVPFGIYKKLIFDSAGCYNEKLVRNHDIEFSKRLLEKGFKIMLAASVRCIYYARESYKQLARNSYENGKWNILTLYITKRLNSLSLRHFIPLIFILSVFLPLVPGILINRLFTIPALLSVLAYAILIVYASIKLKTEKTGIFNIFYGLIVLHISYGFGSLAGIFHPGKLFIKD